jgi:hypothetical protein
MMGKAQRLPGRNSYLIGLHVHPDIETHLQQCVLTTPNVEREVEA